MNPRRQVRVLGLGVLLITAVVSGCARGSDSSTTEPGDPVLAALTEAQRELGLDRRGFAGLRLFEQRCVICHGSQGKGDGFNAYNLDPRPAPLEETVAQATDTYLRKVILYGSASVGLSAQCPPRGSTLTETEMRDLLVFLRSLASPSPNGADRDTPSEPPGTVEARSSPRS